MVFESYVVSILNKFLGQYVENLDPSQFQMSIWGGRSGLFIKPRDSRYTTTQ